MIGAMPAEHLRNAPDLRDLAPAAAPGGARAERRQAGAHLDHPPQVLYEQHAAATGGASDAWSYCAATCRKRAWLLKSLGSARRNAHQVAPLPDASSSRLFWNSVGQARRP
jgi:hypothetical protein